MAGSLAALRAALPDLLQPLHPDARLRPMHASLSPTPMSNFSARHGRRA
jgi:hypothetical protein